MYTLKHLIVFKCAFLIHEPVFWPEFVSMYFMFQQFIWIWLVYVHKHCFPGRDLCVGARKNALGFMKQELSYIELRNTLNIHHKHWYVWRTVFCPRQSLIYTNFIWQFVSLKCTFRIVPQIMYKTEKCCWELPIKPIHIYTSGHVQRWCET